MVLRLASKLKKLHEKGDFEITLVEKRYPEVAANNVFDHRLIVFHIENDALHNPRLMALNRLLSENHLIGGSNSLVHYSKLNTTFILQGYGKRLPMYLKVPSKDSSIRAELERSRRIVRLYESLKETGFVSLNGDKSN